MIVYRELDSVTSDLGFSAKTLYGLSNSIESHYKEVIIPKKSGGERRLHVPDEILKRVQRAIADKLLCLEPISIYATAYRASCDICKNAQAHIGKNKILKLDIYKFFDSIMYSIVKDRAFPADRYSEQIRVLLCMLCYYKDVLPQGAPTSPAVTNIIMRDFDTDVGDWCRTRGISYTRYCDDMTFSGDFDSGQIIDFVSDRLQKEKLILNKKKTAVISSGKRQCVTGIVVNEKANVSAEYKRKIRSEVYYCARYGVSEHLAHIKSNSDEQKYLQSLLGRINFVLHVSPEDEKFLQYKITVLDMIKNFYDKNIKSYCK